MKILITALIVIGAAGCGLFLWFLWELVDMIADDLKYEEERIRRYEK